MSEGFSSGTRPADAVGRVLYVITRTLAIAGGIVFCLMSLLTALSVTGRALAATPFGQYFGMGPITGDFELVAIGTGLGVFAFMPHCQLMRENVIVDFFLNAAPQPVKDFFDAMGSLMFGAAMTFVAWRMYYGALDMYEVGETSMILGIPRWWGFPFAVVCLVLLVIVCVYTLVHSTKGLFASRAT